MKANLIFDHTFAKEVITILLGLDMQGFTFGQMRQEVSIITININLVGRKYSGGSNNRGTRNRERKYITKPHK